LLQKLSAPWLRSRRCNLETDHPGVHGHRFEAFWSIENEDPILRRSRGRTSSLRPENVRKRAAGNLTWPPEFFGACAGPPWYQRRSSCFTESTVKPSARVAFRLFLSRNAVDVYQSCIRQRLEKVAQAGYSAGSGGGYKILPSRFANFSRQKARTRPYRGPSAYLSTLV